MIINSVHYFYLNRNYINPFKRSKKKFSHDSFRLDSFPLGLVFVLVSFPDFVSLLLLIMFSWNWYIQLLKIMPSLIKNFLIDFYNSDWCVIQWITEKLATIITDGARSGTQTNTSVRNNIKEKKDNRIAQVFDIRCTQLYLALPICWCVVQVPLYSRNLSQKRVIVAFSWPRKKINHLVCTSW